jgi:hypothetical protein
VSLSAAILRAALSLAPPWYHPNETPPETPAEYRARVEVIASAVALEVVSLPTLRPAVLGAVALEIFHSETALDPRLHAGTEHPRHHSDHGKARCLGQVWASGIVPAREWETLAGTDMESTRRCTRATLRVFLAQYRRCNPGRREFSHEALARGFAGYAGRVDCKPGTSAMGRAKRAFRLLELIRRPPPKPPTQPAQS